MTRGASTGFCATLSGMCSSAPWVVLFSAFGVSTRVRGAIVAAGLAMMLCSAGCQLFRSQGPISKPMAEARELSQRGLGAMERGDFPGAEALLGQAVKV